MLIEKNPNLTYSRKNKSNNLKLEKASIDWNNYLTQDEVKQFISKDDKTESAENIIYSKEFRPRFKDLHNSLQAKYNNSWTKRELVDDLVSFYNFGNLITESNKNKITLYHNTTNQNAISINKQGIKGGLRLSAYGKGSEAEGSGVWCSTVRGYGYGGATITFEVNQDDPDLRKQNDTEYIVYRDIKPEEIVDIDLVVSTIPCGPRRKNGINSTVESDISSAIDTWGKEKVIKVLGNYPKNFAQPYDIEQLKHLIQTGNKYCKGRIKVTEVKQQLEENKLLEDKRELFNKIKEINKNAKWQNYKDKSNNNIDLKPNGNKDYDTDESMESKTGKGLEYFNDEEIQRSFDIEEKEENKKGLTEAVSTRLVDTTKLPYFEQEISCRAESDDYKSIWRKYINSKSKKIRLTYYELDCISDIYNEDENYKEIEKVLYGNKINESKKLDEVSRNELLSKAKRQTITRYNKAPGYKGFYIVDVDTTSILTTNSLRVTCKVGDYWDTVEMENILYWIQIEAEKTPDKQINTKKVTTAIMNSIDGMDIKVDCNCGDFVYRFAYAATKFGYKYGKPETRPAKITNPNDYGSMCKHLISMLSNKKWLQQITGTVMDFIVKRIVEVNRFLRLEGEDQLTLPNELARRNAKMGNYSKMFDQIDKEQEEQENNEKGGE